MMLILLGAPGAGKGTQAEQICQRLHIPAISTGNILREALKSGTELGLKAKSFMDAGNLVPDDVVIDMLKERISEPDCKDGFILDGFPRTIPQAEALDAMGVSIDRVIDIEVPDEKIVTRMSAAASAKSAAPPIIWCIIRRRWKAFAINARAPLFSVRMTMPKPFGIV